MYKGARSSPVLDISPGSSSNSVDATEGCKGVQICLPPSAQQEWELWLQLADVQPLGSPLCQAQRRDMHHGCWNRPFL